MKYNGLFGLGDISTKEIIRNNKTFILDVIFLWLIYLYLKQIGAENINFFNIISVMSTLIARFHYYNKIHKIHKNLRLKVGYSLFNILLFTFYLSILLIKQNDVNNFFSTENINTLFYMKVVAVLHMICFFFVYRESEIKKIFNGSLGLLFVMSFCYFIMTNNFSNLKELLFGVKSYDSIAEKVSDINIYIGIILLFFISYPFKKSYLFDYGKKISTLLSLLVMVFIFEHIIKNIEKSTIDYELISYYTVILFMTILTINLITEEKLDNKTFYLNISFKILFIMYVIFSDYEIVPYRLLDIIMFLYMVLFVIKKKIFNKIIMSSIILIIFLSLIYMELKLSNFDLKLRSNYSGILFVLVYFMGAYSEEKRKINYIRFFKNIFYMCSFDKIYKEIRIKNERLYRRIYYIDFNIILIRIVFCFLVLMGGAFLIENILEFADYITNKNDFFYYFMHINKATSFICNNIYLTMFCIFCASIALFFLNCFVFITNKRIIYIHIIGLKYNSFDYDQLILNGKKCVFFGNFKILDLKNDDKLHNYLRNKIKK